MSSKIIFNFSTLHPFMFLQIQFHNISVIFNIQFMAQQNTQDDMRDSFIREQQPNICLRVLKKVDIFSFIPVPKDDSVSTKQSLIGTAVFFAIFLTYIIYDFVSFVNSNPPIIQSYRTNLDDKLYNLPRFAYAFMNGSFTNETDVYDNLFTYNWLSVRKSLGGQDKPSLKWDYVKYDPNTGAQTNFDLIPWMSESTKKFYYILRTPTDPLNASGLLYSSDTTSYVRLKLFFCNVGTPTCLNDTTISELSNHGRIFLFIQNQPDQSSISLQTGAANGNNYLLYNFFVLQGLFKRVTINFQVIKDEILPDYFWRWRVEHTQRVQMESVFEEVSNVTFNNLNQDAITFDMQLSPLIINNRVSFTTLLDHVSLWGAFWGVLFAVFALFFLSYNRRKFYKKNPEWSKFKKVNPSLNHSDEDPSR